MQALLHTEGSGPAVPIPFLPFTVLTDCAELGLRAGNLGSQGGSPSTMSPCLHLQPLFTMSAQQPSIVPFTSQAYEELSRKFDRHPVSSPHIVSAWQGKGRL